MKLNDKVILSWIKSSGIQAFKANYISENNTMVNSGIITTFSEYTICSENNLLKKPKNMPAKYACFFGCAFITGAGMAHSFLNKNEDKNIIVYGLGGIGVSVLLYLKSLIGTKVVVIDNDKIKIKFSRKLGFKNSFVSEDFKKLKKKVFLIYKNKADLCFETCGKVSTIENSIDLIKNKGKVIFCSHPESGKKIKIDPHELIKGKKIYGTWGGNINPEFFLNKIYPKFKKNLKYLKLLNNKIYKFNEILTACISALQSYFDTSKWQINQPIILREIYILLDKIEGFQTVKNINILNKVGTNDGYSEYAYDISGATRNNVVYPSLDPMIFEVRYPQIDIQGRVVSL